MNRPLAWRRGLAELGIIVVGVALALAADAWRESLGDRTTEREYLNRLRAELETGRVPIAKNLARVSFGAAAIDTLLTLDRRANLVDSTAFARLSLRAANYEFNPSGIVHDLTYREMSSTGSLNLIRDPALRVRLANYYRLAYRAGDVARQTSANYSDRVRAQIGVDPGPALTPEEFQEDEPVLAAEDRHRLVEALWFQPDVAAELRILRSRLRTSEGWLQRLLTATDSLVLQLQH